MKSNVVFIKQNRVLTDSRHLAEVFGKQHKNVIQSIELQLKDLPEEFNRLNFQLVEYLDIKGENRPMYEMTYDGFTLIAMSFTGKKAQAFKVEYIKEFNKMEDLLSKQGYQIPSTEELLERALSEIRKERDRADKAEAEIITNKENAGEFAAEHLKPMAFWMKEFPILEVKGTELKKKATPTMTTSGCLTRYVTKVLKLNPPLTRHKKGGNRITVTQYDRATILKIVEELEKDLVC